MRHTRLVESILLPLLVMSMMGCGSLFSFSKKAPPPSPAPLRQDPSIAEMQAALLQWSEEEARRTYYEGAESGNPQVDQMVNAISAARAPLGEPAEVVPMPVARDVRSKEVDRLVKIMHSTIGRERERAEEWWEEYESHRSTPVETGWKISSGILRTAFFLLVAGLVVVVVMGAGGSSVLAFLWRRARRGFQEMVGLIDELKKDDPATAEKLKDHLGGRMSKETEKMVKGLRE